jgi:hypothetical protein
MYKINVHEGSVLFHEIIVTKISAHTLFTVVILCPPGYYWSLFVLVHCPPTPDNITGNSFHVIYTYIICHLPAYSVKHTVYCIL